MIRNLGYITLVICQSGNTTTPSSLTVVIECDIEHIETFNYTLSRINGYIFSSDILDGINKRLSLSVDVVRIIIEGNGTCGDSQGVSTRSGDFLSE